MFEYLGSRTVHLQSQLCTVSDGMFGKTPVFNTTVVVAIQQSFLKFDKESGWVNWKLSFTKTE
jgi:hypothetical protein